ncbi:helix-turn-helix domain-containing protein [Kitasatospora sp. GAS204B]|uniref:helix-turn-helix domain-containing protein n=1 Tax=unclassified Kitasatospora TaxID=2633591 RepID=UPI0024731EBD|nr:helix-turn-helix domain-containing protein [Kitasatospora sp. GAS204B]MDH6120099.1 hypothetical protein [Kitasatospora sp. GAS204B]
MNAERSVPDGAARELYLRLVGEGGEFTTDGLSPEELPLLEQLSSVGLVTAISDRSWTVASPRAVGERLREDLRTSGLELFERARELPAALAELTDAYDRSSRPSTGAVAIRQSDVHTYTQRVVQQLAQDCTREILVMQPGGARPAYMLPQAGKDARETASRGLFLHVIYQPGARTDPGTAAYAAYATSLGHRIRILDEDFRRVMVFDRKVAVVAGYGDPAIASFIEDPVLVEVVVETFERDWARAERVHWDEPEAISDGPLVELLARGLTQRAIATRLGLSERTVAAQIARLRERYDARTLFQLGWQMQGGAAE